ncbi:MAG: NTP transferase domain-containing protein [Oscillospiraceae bacterium]
MNRVKRAVIVAAGKGKRMQPITLTTPKPLVKINGVRMIDTVIRGLQANGICEIYVVVGYLKEQFQCLESEYEGLTLVFNPYFESCNNISSLYVARNHIEDAIIIDGDQVIYNQSILSPEFERSGYNAIWTDDATSEWLLTVDNGTVTRCSRTGGSKGWVLYSVSRWSADDARKLKKHLETEFEENSNRQIYWDDVPLFCYPKEYKLGVREMHVGDITEVDSIIELLALDDSYTEIAEKPGEYYEK